MLISMWFSLILSRGWPWISALESVSEVTIDVMARLELDSALPSICKYAPCDVSDIRILQRPSD